MAAGHIKQLREDSFFAKKFKQMLQVAENIIAVK